MTTPHTPGWETLANHPRTAAHNAVIQLIIDLYDVLDPVPPRLVKDVLCRIRHDPNRSSTPPGSATYPNADVGVPGCLPALRTEGLRRSPAGVANRSQHGDNDA